MPLQTSGQIKLSEIAAEFGGSAPHALSEYYGDGNAPSSGEIQLAADFYGTANTFTTNLSYATAVHKSGNETLGFVSSSSTTSGSGFDGGTMPSSLGSIAAQPSTPNITHLYRTCASVAADELSIEFASTFTGWTSITIGSATFTRASAATPGNRSTSVTNRTFQWRNPGFIGEDTAVTDLTLDPFGSGTQNGTASGTVSITLNY